MSTPVSFEFQHFIVTHVIVTVNDALSRKEEGGFGPEVLNQEKNRSETDMFFLSFKTNPPFSAIISTE